VKRSATNFSSSSQIVKSVFRAGQGGAWQTVHRIIWTMSATREAKEKRSFSKWDQCENVCVCVCVCTTLLSACFAEICQPTDRS